ncbi:MAG: hypothetical protein AB7P02_00070 [Alphaproteobacteria bacterium]
MTPADAVLAQIVASADVIGATADGRAFLLVEAPADLIDRMAEFGAAHEDDEDDDPPEDGDPREDDDPDTSVDDEGEPQVGIAPQWPPGKARLEAAIAAGKTVRAVATMFGRSQTAVWRLAKRLGVRWPNERKPRASAPPSRTWPPTEDEVAELIGQGIGDNRASKLFGVHVSTYRALRRRYFCDGVGSKDDGPPVDPAEYGYVGTPLPSGITFDDSPRAAAADRTGRVLRPMTVLERESSIAAC